MSDSRNGATAPQLKHDIDSGRTGDKVRHFDPAAAPLGTDEEAGGASLSPETISLERERERRIGAQAQGAGFSETHGATRAPAARKSFGWALIILLALVLGAIVFLLVHGIP